MTRGWWRRNVWGLVLVLPLLVGVFATNGPGWYEANFVDRPQRPVTVDGTGKAVLGDYAIRVVQAKPVENKAELTRWVRRDTTLPTSVKVWRVIITVAAPPVADGYNPVGGCEMALLDAAGHAYPMAPSELTGASGLGGCGPDDEEQPSPYTATNLFLLPAEVSPTGIRITWDDLLPRYILFPIVQ